MKNRLILVFGGIYDPYANDWYDSRDSVQIGRIVAQREAHISGMCAQPNGVKERFAEDSLNLALIHYATNRAKSSRDAAEWLPVHNSCWFAKRIVDIKGKYNLSVDAAEHAALHAALSACDTFELQMAPARYPEVLYGDMLSCGPYANCTALEQDHPDGVSLFHCAYRPQMDGDKDGWACGR